MRHDKRALIEAVEPLRRQGLKLREIAAALGISKTYVQNICVDHNIVKGMHCPHCGGALEKFTKQDCSESPNS